MKLPVLLACLALLSFTCSVLAANGRRPMIVDDLFRFKRLADPEISPDGQLVVYAVSTVDLANNQSATALWLAPTDKGPPRQLTNAPGKKDRHPRWSPDGKQILFESNRSGDNQLWIIDVGGGEARQLTKISTEAGHGIWSPDGQTVAFVSAVFPENSDKPYAESDAANKKRKDEKEKNPVKARVFSKLFFRHWNEWVEDKRQHLFVVPAAGGDPRNVTPGDRDAYPTSSTFSVGDDFTFSPDGKYLVYTASPERDEAWSTHFEILRVPVAGGKPESLTKDNPAASGAPRFSPDGKKLAYRAQKQAGSEADRWQMMLVDTDASGAVKGKPRSLTANLDHSVSVALWTPDSQAILFTHEDRGMSAIAAVAVSAGEPWSVAKGGTMSALSVSHDGKKLAFLKSALDQSAEVFAIDFPASKYKDDARPFLPLNISQANTTLLAELDLPRPESVTVEGAGGTPMQMWILKPPGFDPKKKWPLAYIVHGGPQGAWSDGWGFRWNAEIWAAQGYVVALPNPRGSTGFGQKYTEEISGDWGGKCFDDLMAGVAYMEKQPYIDTDRMGAAGASFGGYMMNWFEGHTTKFKTLICHCGVYNFESMYATTEELWFDEWEHGGVPWEKPEEYARFSPHRYAKNFKTPMLIVHGDLDFRVPIGEGLQLFTTLQRLHIPSKMINFPDEGHWVEKPANSAFWHREVFAWLAKYVPPGPK
jgi:dipeptidyl aminopeptidase/acylaminoacyl peptidase